jgi:hypothetical protein
MEVVCQEEREDEVGKFNYQASEQSLERNLERKTWIGRRK